jgi:hypothetical protein
MPINLVVQQTLESSESSAVLINQSNLPKSFYSTLHFKQQILVHREPQLNVQRVLHF